MSSTRQMNSMHGRLLLACMAGLLAASPLACQTACPAAAAPAKSPPSPPPSAAAPTAHSAARPADRATDVAINVRLSWEPVAGAKGYDVYFGPTNPPAYQCQIANPQFVLETLSAGKTYYWRTAPVLVDGPAKDVGPVQKFTKTAKADRDALYDWPIRIANSVRKQYPTPEDLRGWNYTEGIIADGLYSIALRTGRDADLEFVKKWLDRFVNADGVIDDTAYNFKLYSLDRVRPGQALLWTYDRTKDASYLKAVQTLIKQLDEQPRTSDGGYWHRSTYPNQMWLDGIYMADVLSVQFGVKTNDPKHMDEAIKQATLIHKHTFDPKSGLYFHGWDETKTRPWANKETGTSPELWGLAIGWYAMAMADILDWLPADHPGRKEVMPIYQNLCKSLLKYQDHDTAMWWQIIDKPNAEKNYVETSCSLMFSYAMAKGAQRGWLPPEYLEHARRATRGVLNREVDLLPNNCMDIRGTVSVGSLSGAGNYDYYVNVNLALNDPKSVGTFEFLSVLLSDTANDTGPAGKEFPKAQSLSRFGAGELAATR